MKQLVDLKLGKKSYTGITIQKLSFLLDDNARKFGSWLDRPLFEAQISFTLSMNNESIIMLPAFKYIAEITIHK